MEDTRPGVGTGVGRRIAVVMLPPLMLHRPAPAAVHEVDVGRRVQVPSAAGRNEVDDTKPAETRCRSTLADLDDAPLLP